MHVETEIEPPDLSDWPDDEDDDGDDTVDMFVLLSEVDGTRRAATVSVSGDADDEQLADALVAGLLGCAAMRGPALTEAVRRRLS